jgi:O-methyltransferase
MSDARSLYLDLMKRVLLNVIFGEEERGMKEFEKTARMEGREWPAIAHTMIGWKRLENIQQCMKDILGRNIPGDLIETGVWRGGAIIFMRAILKAYDVTDRCVWGADSFKGLPKPDPTRYPADEGDVTYSFSELAVSLDEVRANFEKYGLLDEQVRFLPGWFRDTLPKAPIERLSLIRLDGDMYESTYIALESLYPKLSPGGYLIVDDYGACAGCRKAVDDFRVACKITDEIIPVDWTGVYWQRLGD